MGSCRQRCCCAFLCRPQKRRRMSGVAMIPLEKLSRHGLVSENNCCHRLLAQATKKPSDEWDDLDGEDVEAWVGFVNLKVLLSGSYTDSCAGHERAIGRVGGSLWRRVRGMGCRCRQTYCVANSQAPIEYFLVRTRMGHRTSGRIHLEMRSRHGFVSAN